MCGIHTHGEGTDQEQGKMPEIHLLAGMDGGQRDRPPAWNQQEPGADRSIKASEPQIGAGPAGSQTIDPIPG